jgi:hypothetical protein
MALTITIPGAVEATIGATAPAVLTIGVGVPGATGPAGAAGAPGQGVPAGGTTGQVLQKASGVDYATQWSTPSGGTWGSITGTLSNQTDLQSALNAKLSTATAASTYYPLTGNPSGFITSSALSGYATQSWVDAQGYLQAGALSPYLTSATAASTYFPIPTGNTTQYIAGDGTLITFPTLATANKLTATVYNETGSTITKGSVVYIVGAHGNLPTIALSQANSEATSAGTYGLVSANIGNNSSGTIVIAGVIENLDTQALVDGDKLYLSPTVAGGYTTTKPSAPYHMVYVGVVTRAHPTQGTIQLRIANGFELGEIHDVALASVTDNDLLAYDAATSLWKNESFSTLGLLTSATAGTTYAALSGATFTGEVSTPASTTSSAGLSILPGVAPSAPTNGEIWNTGSDIQVRLGGVTETLAEQSWVSSQGYLTSSALTPYAPLSGATFTGLVTTLAPTTGTAGFNLPHGVAPTTPVNGDVWSTTGGLFWRQNGSTYQAMNLSATQTVSGSITFSNASQTLGNSTAASTINIGTGATLTATTKAINIGTNGVSGSTTNVTVGSSVAGSGVSVTVNGSLTTTGSTQTINNSTAASTTNIGTGATLTATTKAVNIGTNGVAGSTTNIAIGSTTGTNAITINGPTTLAGSVIASGIALDLGNSNAAATYTFGGGSTTTGLTKSVNIGTNGGTGSTTTITIGTNVGGTSNTSLLGSTTAPTAAADTNSTVLATTAFVVGQAGSATPVVDGTAAVGTSLRYARQDHVHPTDTSRAALASPTFTGTPLSTTAAADTNTTQIATTAYVVGQASSTAPVIDGTATVGTSLKYARADHVHPTDTSRAALAGATFTGKVNTLASSTTTAGLNVPHGAAPTTPTNGDLWTTTTGVYVRINGATQALSTATGAAWGSITGTLSSQTDLQTALNAKLDSTTAASTYQTIAGMSSYATTSSLSAYAPLAGATFSGLVSTPASATGSAGFRIVPGVAPTTPTNGDVWGTITEIQARINGATETLARQSWVTSQGYLTSAPVTSVAGRTGAVTLAVADVSGAAPLASPTFTGTVTIPTGASISGYATTASLASYAPLASPSLTGVPLSTTAAADTNTTQIATTAYVIGQGYLKSATASSTYAPLASPALTGTPTAPTATAGTNTTQIATTAFVTAAIPTNNVKAWVNFNGTGTVAIRAALNVSSITDNGVGDYTVNFTTALADINYSAVATGSLDGTSAAYTVAIAFARSTTPFVQAPTTTTARFVFGSGTNAANVLDPQYANVAIFR